MVGDLDFMYLPRTGESFEGKTVAILGAGNAAFEAADVLAPHVNYVHVNKGHKVPPTHQEIAQFVSWESRYVGGLRAMNAQLLDSYLLKSLDGAPTFDMAADSMIIRPCGYRSDQTSSSSDGNATKVATKLCIWGQGERIHTDEGERKTAYIGDYSRSDQKSGAFVRKIASHRVYADTAAVGESNARMLVARSGEYRQDAPLGQLSLTSGGIHHDIEAVEIYADAITPQNVDRIMAFSRRSGTPHPMIYDTVINCLGWVQNQTALIEMFGQPPLLQPNGRFPVMTHELESTNIPGLYFAGAITHGKDFKRSAGGFIHGFRYNARFLARLLQVRHSCLTLAVLCEQRSCKHRSATCRPIHLQPLLAKLGLLFLRFHVTSDCP
eukprot:m.364396 g.364396  ORF g.364396 m.364396 type:complete len:381 (-) comp20808_c0_seq36:3472-4614(-)